MRRDFLKAVKKPADLLRALRQIAFGGLVVGAGLTTPTTAGATEAAGPVRVASTATIVDRSKKAAKLVLQLPNSVTGWVAQHRSHRSHSSHRSHYSSTGGGSAAPAPVRPVAPPPRAVAPRTSLMGIAANVVIGEIESIDKVKRMFVVKQGEALKTTFAYRDDTNYQTSIGLSVRFDEFPDAASGQLPISVGQKVDVTWKKSTDGKTNIATVVLWKIQRP